MVDGSPLKQGYKPTNIQEVSCLPLLMRSRSSCSLTCLVCCSSISSHGRSALQAHGHGLDSDMTQASHAHATYGLCRTRHPKAGPHAALHSVVLCGLTQGPLG